MAKRSISPAVAWCNGRVVTFAKTCAPVGSRKPGPTSLAACRQFLQEFRRSARR